MKTNEKNLVEYIKNPDVVLREEDIDGALLFNPDTNQIKVLNTTGLFIWKLCEKKHNIANIIKALKNSFDQVPDDKAAEQVKSFINEMKESGFIGIIKDQKE